MRIFRGYSEIKTAFPAPVLTIGNFDGLHLGHREIIQSVIDRAKAEKGTSIVYTFRPHPHLALVPAKELQLINTYDEKLELLEAMGVDVVIEEAFSREFSEITPEKFFGDVLMKHISPRAIYVGYDFGFGKNRSGSLDTLRQFCSNQGVELHITNPAKISGEVCSSSRIREYILTGDVQSASRLLGRHFFYRGLVVRGKARGRTIGFPTANVHTESKLRVKEGVYATWAVYEGHIYPSVTNVGRQPTFNADVNSPIAFETYIMGFDKDIYGENLEVRMVVRLRDEIKFAGINELVVQIKRDVEKAKEILKK